VQGSLILNPPHEEDHMSRPFKWCNLGNPAHWTLDRCRIAFAVLHGASHHKHIFIKCQCAKCKVGFCMHPCFRTYYTKVKFWVTLWERNNLKKWKYYTFHY